MARLDPGDVEHLVDQREEVLSGLDDVERRLALGVGRGLHVEQLREAEHSVERRAQLVAHAREELVLGPVCLLGADAGELEVFEQPGALGDVAGAGHDGRRVRLVGGEAGQLRVEDRPVTAGGAGAVLDVGALGLAVEHPVEGLDDARQVVGVDELAHRPALVVGRLALQLPSHVRAGHADGAVGVDDLQGVGQGTEQRGEGRLALTQLAGALDDQILGVAAAPGEHLGDGDGKGDGDKAAGQHDPLQAPGERARQRRAGARHEEPGVAPDGHVAGDDIAGERQRGVGREHELRRVGRAGGVQGATDLAERRLVGTGQGRRRCQRRVVEGHDPRGPGDGSGHHQPGLAAGGQDRTRQVVRLQRVGDEGGVVDRGDGPHGRHRRDGGPVEPGDARCRPRLLRQRADHRGEGAHLVRAGERPHHANRLQRDPLGLEGRAEERGHLVGALVEQPPLLVPHQLAGPEGGRRHHQQQRRAEDH